MKTYPLAVAYAAALAMTAAAPANADGYIDSAEASYIMAYGPTAICPVIDLFPNAAGVLGVAQGIVNDGFFVDNAVDIINAAVWEYCPRHWALLKVIGAQARGEAILKRTT
jgi:hypothetical protein